MDKKDLYTTKLTREEAYMLFLATGETNLTLLPPPYTDAETTLYEMCEQQVIGSQSEQAPETEPEADTEETSKRKKTAATKKKSHLTEG